MTIDWRIAALDRLLFQIRFVTATYRAYVAQILSTLRILYWGDLHSAISQRAEVFLVGPAKINGGKLINTRSIETY